MFESKCQPLIFGNKKYVLDNQDGELKEILSDFSASGRENPFSRNKRMTNYLSTVYHNFNLPDNDDLLPNGRKPSDYKRIPSKLSYCSNYFEFVHLKNSNEKHLSYGEGCHCSLCPSCNFFRARNNLRNMIEVLEEFFKVPSNCDYPFIFLTLTVPACPGSELRTTIKRMNKAWNKFINYKEIHDSIIGCSRSFEVTVNNKLESDNYGLFHPHFHVLLVMKKDYFLFHRCEEDDKYMNKLQWLLLWQRSLGLHKFRPTVANQYVSKTWRMARNDCFAKWCTWFGAFFTSGKPLEGHLLPSAPADLVTDIDVRRVDKWRKGCPSDYALRCISILGEVVKYNFKPDNIITGDLLVDTERVYWLDGALYHLRRWNLTGVLRDIFKNLGLTDEEQADFIQIVGIDIEQIAYITGWWYSNEHTEYLRGKCKTIEQKNRARRALGLPLLDADAFSQIQKK